MGYLDRATSTSIQSCAGPQVDIFSLSIAEAVRSEAKLGPGALVTLVRPSIPAQLKQGTIPQAKRVPKGPKASSAEWEEQWSHCKHLLK